MLVFRIPDSWSEETYRDGGASYFEGSAESGSLCVTLTTAQQPAAVSEPEFRELANMGRGPGDDPAQRLPGGNYLRRFERPHEGDPPQHVTFWMVSNIVPPRTARIALFNYGVPASQAGSAAHRACVAMLDDEIPQTRFTTLTPEDVAAAQRAARPWWRFW